MTAAIEYGRLTLSEGMLIDVDQPPVNGHNGYFLLDKDDDRVTLFHVQSLKAFDMKRKGVVTRKNFTQEFEFDAMWKPTTYKVPDMLTRLRFWVDSYDTNGIQFAQGPVKKLLGFLEGIDPDTYGDLRPKSEIMRHEAMQEAALTGGKAAAQRGKERKVDLRSKEEKVAPMKKALAAKKPPGPGVIETVVLLLTKKWQTLDAIADELKKRFPDRDRASMIKTVKTQVSGRITKERGIALEYDRKTGKVKLT